MCDGLVVEGEKVYVFIYFLYVYGEGLSIYIIYVFCLVVSYVVMLECWKCFKYVVS